MYPLISSTRVAPSIPSGYQMIRSAEISNFRCFKHTSVKDCRKINIITGNNGGGKTAFLESLFIALGRSPEVVLRLRGWRGNDAALLIGLGRNIEDALWRDLFHNLDGSSPITIGIEGSPSHARSLSIAYGERDLLVRLDEKSQEAGSQRTMQPAIFTYLINGAQFPVIPQLSGGQMLMNGSIPDQMLWPEIFFFAASNAYSAVETAGRFSNLSRKFESQKMVEQFSQQFKSIVDLSIEIQGGSPIVFASLEGFSEKLPLTSVSGGMNKLAAILSAIASERGTVILIDEIENGFHHSKLKSLWNMLLRLSREYGAQVFASTHSWECLEAASDLARESPGDFSVINAAHGILRQSGGENFANAVEQNIDIR